MIDDACILFSVIMCAIVAYRAAKLDRLLPWFRPEPASPGANHTRSPPGAVRRR